MGTEKPAATGSEPRSEVDDATPQSGFIRKSGIAVLGFIVVLIGIPMIPLPGPGWLVVFAGVAILAREFNWAARLRDQIRNRVRQAVRSRERS